MFRYRSTIMILIITLILSILPANASNTHSIELELLNENPYFLPIIYMPCLQSLRENAAQNDFKIGAAANIKAFLEDPLYREVLGREFNSITDEWTMKFEPIHPHPNTYDFSAADTLVEFAEQNDMDIRGHTLVWHSTNPDWIMNGNWTRDELIAVLRDHIHTVVGHYKGRIAVWDVANEFFRFPDGKYQDSIWLDVIGPDYVEMAFQWAHEADPDALLFYNDRAEIISPLSDSIYAMVKDFKERSIPIDGVGFQMHLQWKPNPQDITENINRFAELGVQIHFTEVDIMIVGIPGSFEEKLEVQAERYRDYLNVCITNDACTSFTTWGFTDKYSWVYDYFGFQYPTEAPLLFHPNYDPKPAYYAVMRELCKYEKP